MKNKKIYENPTIEIIELSVEDIITTSAVDGTETDLKFPWEVVE